MELADFAYDFVDKNISELIAGGNYRQAIKNLDKKLKKPARTQHLATLKAALLRENADLFESQKLCQNIIAQSSSLLLDEIRELLFYTLVELKEGGAPVDEKTVEELWTKAIAQQRDVNQRFMLSGRWASLAIERGQWQQFVKAAQQLYSLSSKNSTEARRYRSWQTFGRYMLHLQKQRSTINPTGPDLDRQLAVRALQQAAKDTPVPSEAPKENSTVISSSRDLKLLAEVFRREGLNSELLGLLGQLKFDNIMGDDYAFDYTRSLLWSGALTQNHEEAMEWAKRVIHSAYLRKVQWQLDDWSAWKILIEGYLARLRCDPSDSREGIIQDFHQFFAANAPTNPKSRSPGLAYCELEINLRSLKVAAHHPGTSEAMQESSQNGIPGESESTLSQCAVEELAEFMQELHLLNKSEALEQSKSLIQGLGLDSFEGLEPKAMDTRLRSTISALSIEITRSSTSMSRAIIERNAGSALELYKNYLSLETQLPPSDVPIGNAALMLAARSLRQLADGFDDATARYLSCLCMLVPASSKQDLHARFGLINILQERGASSFAWKRYAELDVKNVLIEPMAPMMFCRISCTVVAATKELDIRPELLKALDFYDRTLGQVPRWQDLALNRENYTEALGMGDFVYELKASPVRWMMGLERRRIARLRGAAYDEDDESFSPSKMPPQLSSKTRDSWTHGTGPALSVDYVNFLAYLDDLAALIRCAVVEEHGYIERLIARGTVLSASSKSGLLTVEVDILNIYKLILEAVRAIEDKTVEPLEALQTLEQHLRRLVTEETQRQALQDMKRDALPCHPEIAAYSLKLELLRNCYLFSQKVSGRIKKQGIKAQIEAIKATVTTLSNAVFTLIKQQRQKLQDLEKCEGHMQDLLGLEVTEDNKYLFDMVMAITGQERANHFFRALVTSCRLSLNGLENIQVC